MAKIRRILIDAIRRYNPAADRNYACASYSIGADTTAKDHPPRGADRRAIVG
jgi:hypothetical protein